MTDHIIRLDRDALVHVRAYLDHAIGYGLSARVWIDPIDQAFKIKPGNETWSPPMGTVVES